MNTITSTTASSTANEANDVLQQIKQAASEAETALELLTQRLAETQQLNASALTQSAELTANHNQSIAIAKELEQIRTSVLSSQASVDDLQAVIASKSKHIEDAREHADNTRAAMDGVLAKIKQDAAQIVVFTEAAVSNATDIESTSKAVVAKTESIATILKTIDTQEAEARESAAILKKLATTAEEANARIMAYESELAGLINSSNKQLDVIVGLLPGATSAGLASAFEKRQNTFRRPVERWQSIYIGSIALLAILASAGIVQALMADHLLGYDELFRNWLTRLPFVGALIWLALYASREASLARRLEEDYGYKAAIATAFEGFQNQMKGIVNAGDVETPLSRLCTDTLAIIANPPGRIYEKHALTVTPGSELGEAVKTVSGLATTAAAK